jgi:hypothetical protein
VSVFIDWDHDGSFLGSDELVARVTNQPSLATTLKVSGAAPLGSARMRVMLGCGRVPGPCDYETFVGEVEDYTINVVP